MSPPPPWAQSCLSLFRAVGGGRRRKWLLIFVDIPAAGQKAAGVFHHNYPHRVWQSVAVRCDRCNVRPGTESFTTTTMLSPLTLTGRGGGGAFISELEISPHNQKLRSRVISDFPPSLSTYTNIIDCNIPVLVTYTGRCLIWQAMKQCLIFNNLLRNTLTGGIEEASNNFWLV